jgi:hypothetical protein
LIIPPVFPRENRSIGRAMIEQNGSPGRQTMRHKKSPTPQRLSDIGQSKNGWIG